MVNFLDLALELRLEIYGYALPTPDKPEILIYDPLVNTQKQSFLALWRTCKTIHAELPTISSLLQSGAVIPALNVNNAAISEVWEESLDYLNPYLKHAQLFRLHVQEYDPITDSFLSEEDGSGVSDKPYILPGSYREFTQQWIKSLVVKRAMQTWFLTSGHLAANEVNTRSSGKRQLCVYQQHVGLGDNAGLPLFLYTETDLGVVIYGRRTGKPHTDSTLRLKEQFLDFRMMYNSWRRRDDGAGSIIRR